MDSGTKRPLSVARPPRITSSNRSPFCFPLVDRYLMVIFTQALDLQWLHSSFLDAAGFTRSVRSLFAQWSCNDWHLIGIFHITQVKLVRWWWWVLMRWWIEHVTCLAHTANRRRGRCVRHYNRSARTCRSARRTRRPYTVWVKDNGRSRRVRSLWTENRVSLT